MVEFIEFPKIPRGNGEIVTITEKIDGTNACIIIEEFVSYTDNTSTFEVVGAQSRSRLISPGNDNYGFATWVEKHKEELVKLGPGYHYGEWAGEGIQKNHHNIEGKQFFLFNTARWNPDNPNRPSICNVVKTLYEGPYTETIRQETMDKLWKDAKEAGYHPEGIVIWYHKGRRYEKLTFENVNGKWSN